MNGDENLPDDPGWPWYSTTVLPGMTRRYLVMHSADDQRRVLRTITVGFVEMIVGLAILGIWMSTGGAHDASPVLIGASGVAMVAPLFARRLGRGLDCSSNVALAESYRTRFFLRAAFANVPALAAFVVIATGGPAWLFGVGLTISIATVFFDAPTRARLAREDAALAAGGCGRSLVAALAGGAL